MSEEILEIPPGDDPVRREAEERSAPSGKIVYKAIMKEGEEELARPTAALFWSGLHAGWASVPGCYVAPTLLGNVAAGVTLVATLNHAQIVAGGGGEDV